MFVQISPSSSDLGETLCSLNFASRVRGIESGPARKQADLSELFKYKQMVCPQQHIHSLPHSISQILVIETRTFSICRPKS